MDRNEIMARLENDGLAISELDETYKADEELVTIALQQNGLALQYLSESQKANKKFVLLAVTQNPFAIQFAAPALRDNEKVLTQAYQRYPFWWSENPGGLEVIEYASEAQQNNIQLLLRLLKYDAQLIYRFPGHYLYEEYFMRKAFTINGEVMKYAEPHFKSNRSMVLAAAKSKGYFIVSPQFERFWTDREIMLAACITNSAVFEVLPQKFKNDPKFIAKVLKKSTAGRSDLVSLPKTIIHNKDVVLSGFELNSELLYQAAIYHRLLDDDDFIFKVYEKLSPNHHYFKMFSKLLLLNWRKNRLTQKLRKKVPKSKHLLLRRIININPAAATYFGDIINPPQKKSSKAER